MIKQLAVAALTAMLLAGMAVLAIAGDKPTFDFDWYGYFKLDGAYDQTRTNPGNYQS